MVSRLRLGGSLPYFPLRLIPPLNQLELLRNLKSKSGLTFRLAEALPGCSSGAGVGMLSSRGHCCPSQTWKWDTGTSWPQGRVMSNA